MKTGIELIAQERAEQIEKHGRTLVHDSNYNEYEQLKEMAVLLISNGEHDVFYECDLEVLPYGWDEDSCRKMMIKPYKERLTIAAALIAAEIDRIQK